MTILYITFMQAVSDKNAYRKFLTNNIWVIDEDDLHICQRAIKAREMQQVFGLKQTSV